MRKNEGILPKSDIMLADMNDFVSYLTVRRRLADNSIRLVTTRLAYFQRWIAEQNAPLSKMTVERFIFSLKERGLRNNSINSYVFMLMQLERYMRDRGMPTDNFTEGLVILDKNPRPIEILTPDEIEKLLDVTISYGKWRQHKAEYVTESLNQLYRIFTRFLATTGARFSEAADLTGQYVDLATGRVTFVDTKNKTNRAVWIAEPLISEMKLCVFGKKPTDRVFTNFVGSKMIPQNYAIHLRRAAAIVGITKHLHPHIFRHSFATQLLVSGVDVTMVASILGHKDIQTTYQSYVHLADETLKKSIYRHPLVQKHIDPREILKMIREAVGALHIENDQRFDYNLAEGPQWLKFGASIKPTQT